MSQPVVAVIDYDIGNSKSMLNALVALGLSPILSRDPGGIAAADALILPGVGAFCQGMGNLEKYSLLDAIHRFIAQDKPFLGVCLGMQLLLEESEEFGVTVGMGVIKGKVKKLAVDPTAGEKLPHIGWNAVCEPDAARWTDSIFATIPDSSDVYFVHSFAAIPVDESDILSITRYGSSIFCSSLHKGNIWGCQFHPEKSGPIGLTILRNFVTLAGYEEGI